MNTPNTDLESGDESLPDIESAVPTAFDVVDDICDEVPQTTPDDRRVARAIASAISLTMVDSGKSAVGMAASCLYIAGVVTGNNDLSQSVVTENIDTTDVTVRNNYRSVSEGALENDEGELDQLTDSEMEVLEQLAETSVAEMLNRGGRLVGGGFDE